MQNLLLSPSAGAKLLRTDGNFQDQGQSYVFEMILRPVWAEGGWGQWQAFGVELRHNSACTLVVTPIVDGVTLDGQAYTIQVGQPTGFQRTVHQGRIQAWGQKATLRFQVISALTGQFYLEGAWFDVRVQERHAPV